MADDIALTLRPNTTICCRATIERRTACWYSTNFASRRWEVGSFLHQFMLLHNASSTLGPVLDLGQWILLPVIPRQRSLAQIWFLLCLGMILPTANFRSMTRSAYGTSTPPSTSYTSAMQILGSEIGQ